MSNVRCPCKTVPCKSSSTIIYIYSTVHVSYEYITCTVCNRILIISVRHISTNVLVCAADIENIAITQRCTEIQNELNHLKKENASHIRRAKYASSRLFSNPVPVL